MLRRSGVVPLTIDEPTGVRRENWPVRRGVPFPPGVLSTPAHVRLVNPDGTVSPCVVEATARWPDGSVKWILIDFPVTLAPQASAVFRLEYGPGVSHEPPPPVLRVHTTAAAIQVRTGPLSFTVSRDRFALLEQVQLQGRPVLPAQRLWVMDADGTIYDTAQADAREVVIEERSARRVVIRARGCHASTTGHTFLSYLVRICAWADLPWVQLEYTFINTEDAAETEVRTIALDTELELDPARTGRCGSGRRIYASAEPFSFGHDQLLERYGVFAGSPIYDARGNLVQGVGLYEQQIARGWLDVSDPQRGVCVALRDFLPMYPKAAAWDGDRVTFQLWPDSAPALRLHQGMARTHTFMIHCHAGDEETARAGELATAFGEPLLPRNAAWYLDSGALGHVLPFRPERYPRLERQLRDLTVEARNTLSQGMIDYGDCVNPGTGSQGGFSTNNEPDRLHGFILQHLRSGERIPWQLAEAIAWHVADVDVVHHTTRSGLELGGQRIHGHGHVQYDAEGYPDVSTVPSHMWTEGLLEYYYLTGHRHLRDIALGIGACFLNMVQAGWCRPPYHSNWHSVRDSGWPLIGMAAVYEATGDRRYLQAMREIAAALRQAQHADGGWPIELLYHTGFCPFQIAVCLTGLARYHQISGDAAARETFLRGLRFLAGDAMRFADDAWVYVTTPDYRSTYAGASPLEPFGYGYALTGDRDMLRQVVRGWAGELDLRAAPRFLWALDAAGLLEPAGAVGAAPATGL